ncbi:Type I secretion outer membrane protein, TolC precursor [plant metagenome]|uniref:Type I secretion outer membrane protein, TolC n=1 Tax=plant metagenome TaxID=1297885 RepID=A0A484R3V9_9ZZZZ
MRGGLRKKLVLLSLVGAALLGSSLPAAAQDLMQSWQAALARDPVYAAARAAYRAGQERLPQARAALRPTVTAEVGAEYLEVRGASNLSRADSGNRGTWALALTQPLFDRAAWETMDQARLLVADNEVALAQAQQALILRLSQAYFDVLAAQDTLAAIEAEKSAVAEQLAFAKRNFELGNATVTDTYEAQSRYDLLIAQELAAGNTLDLARDTLATVTGERPLALAELPYETRLPTPAPARQDDWITQATSASLAVQRTQLQTQAAQRGIEIARSGHYPRLDLRASSGSATNSGLQNRNLPASLSGRPLDSNVGVVLSIPIYTGGGTSSRVTEQVELAEQARQNAMAARLEAERDARQFFSGVTTGLARIRALEAGELSSRSAVQANRTGYEMGVRINLDVLNAQQQLYTTLRDLARARYDTVMAGLRLRAATGTLSENDLEAVNRLLVPATGEPGSRMADRARAARQATTPPGVTR